MLNKLNDATQKFGANNDNNDNKRSKDNNTSNNNNNNNNKNTTSNDTSSDDDNPGTYRLSDDPCCKNCKNPTAATELTVKSTSKEVTSGVGRSLSSRLPKHSSEGISKKMRETSGTSRRRSKEHNNGQFNSFFLS